jgi:membrane protease YdiL (CAAX protease family)
MTTTIPAATPSEPAILRRPILLWGGYLMIVTAIAITAKAIWPDLGSGPSGLSWLQVGLQLLITVIVLPFAAMVGWREIGLTRWASGKDALVLLFPVATVLFGFVPGFRAASVETVSIALASVALAGIGEEIAFRGILLRLLRVRGLWPAVIVSSALFGLLHVANLFVGSPWYTVLLQVTFSAMAGVGYAAMRLRTGSLLVPILLHAVYDLTFRLGNIEPGSTFQYVVFMLHGVGWLAYGIIVLRRSKRDLLVW